MPSSSLSGNSRVRAALAVALTHSFLATGCAHSPAATPRVVALMPVDVVGLPPESGSSLHQALERELRASGGARLASPGEVAGALERAPAGAKQCLASEPCLIDVGRAVEANTVLALTLAGLGATRLVRSRLLEVSQGLVLQDLQETVVDEPGALDKYAGNLSSRLFPDPQRNRAWYRQWWVWTGAGVAVAGVISVIAISQKPREPGVVHLGRL